jgi:MYXO-CTERM domain-containing protein
MKRFTRSRERLFGARLTCGAVIMRSTVSLALALGLAAGCAVPDPVEATSSAIIDGMLDSGDPSMVEMFAISGNMAAKCTCTLVSPHVLLTAAHCIAETQGFRYGVFLGNNDSRITGKDLLAVASADFDPAYNDNPSQGHDIGVVVLAQPLPMPLVPMNRGSLASSTGKMTRYIGYGLTDGVAQSGDGTKRQAMAPIAQVGKSLIRIANNPNNTCNGDSGGPLLMDTGSGEAIIGVVSFGTDMNCGSDSYFQRLDTQIDWVDQQIKQADPNAVLPTAGGGSSSDGGTAAADGAASRDAAAAPPPSPDAAPPPPDAAPLPPVVVPLPVVTDAGAIAPPPPDAAPTPTGVRSNLVQGGCGCELGAHQHRGSALGVLLTALALFIARRRRP